MNPAEFDTRRRYLGLSIDEVAELCGVGVKTVNRWQSGQLPILPAALERLAALEAEMKHALRHIVAQAIEARGEYRHAAAAGGDPGAGQMDISLTRYRTRTAQDNSPHASSLPFGAHAILTAWAADALRADDFSVVIQWSDGAD